ncbi:kinase-like protein [Viridothelium virens]|uniref:Kinase-like protein n=1 Tax=Viridothelium virens TaxID=1048519 RepID=A0A6A6H5G6_VIRVR|nr:kinase-like protein [Viridothelium virens]
MTVSLFQEGEDEHQESTAEEDEEDVETLKAQALVIANKVATELYGANSVLDLELLGQGAYNHVWLVTFHTGFAQAQNETSQGRNFALRIPRNTLSSLQPYQMRHEVACLQFIADRLPKIPAPKVYAWEDGLTNCGYAYIAEEFIQGERLSVVWPLLTEEEKSTICWEIANVIADLGETRFQSISGLDPHSAVGPTVEGAKVFNGRPKFHSPECYNIGPYRNSKDYVLSCYDREIYYYTHTDEGDIISEAFEQMSVMDFVTQLKLERQALVGDELTFQQIDAERLVLVHEDFHAGNMLVRDGHLVGVLDWEFSGVYPLSQLLGPTAILQISAPNRDESTEDEETEWQKRYKDSIAVVLRQRGWTDDDIKIAIGDEHPLLYFVKEYGVENDFQDVETADVYVTQEAWNEVLEVIKLRERVRKRKPDAGPLMKRKVVQGQEGRDTMGMLSIVGAVVWPGHTQNVYLLVCRIFELCLEKGLNFQTNTCAFKLAPSAPLQSDKSRSAGWTVQTDCGNVHLHNIVLATNAYTNALYASLASTRFSHPRPQPTATTSWLGLAVSAAKANILYGAGHSRAPGKELGISDGSVINPGIAEYLSHAAPRFFGKERWGEEGAELRDWTGMTCYTPDSLPLVGQAPGEEGLWCCVEMNGHGMAMAWRGAEALVSMMLEGTEPEWFPKAMRLERA